MALTQPKSFYTLITLFVSSIVMQSLILEMMLIQLTLQTQALSISQSIAY